jgi:excisionase family DNA binding protein
MRDQEPRVARSSVTPRFADHLLTIPEAAEFLNVPVRWLQDAVQQRRVRCTRIGKHVRFTAEHLVELITAGEQPVTEAPRHVKIPVQRRSGRSRL